MKRTESMITVVIAIFLTAFAWGVYTLFHGGFDNGDFHIQQAVPSSSGQLAIVAKRSDQQALGGEQYFVVVEDHLPSPADLKRSYYYDGIVFRAGSDCLDVRWKSTRVLLVMCRDSSIKADQIAVERQRTGNVTVEYENIPAMTKR
jgi:hypothetical protein